MAKTIIIALNNSNSLISYPPLSTEIAFHVIGEHRPSEEGQPSTVMATP